MNIESLIKRQQHLKNEIAANLDLLVGTVAKSPTMSGYNLTTKVDKKTVTVYVRKSIAPQAKEMTKCHKKVRALIQKLSKVNWELLKLKAS